MIVFEYRINVNFKEKFIMFDQLEIVDVIGREIIDSRGNPTVEAEVILADGTVGRGASQVVLLQVNSKHLNLEIRILTDTLVRVFLRL